MSPLQKCSAADAANATGEGERTVCSRILGREAAIWMLRSMLIPSYYFCGGRFLLSLRYDLRSLHVVMCWLVTLK